jgi:hypothetical protein
MVPAFAFNDCVNDDDGATETTTGAGIPAAD